MSGGINWTGGRGKLASRLPNALERGPKEHFAKQRVINYSQTTQATPNTSNPRHAPIVTLKHAQRQGLEQQTPGETLLKISRIAPNVMDKPNKPTKQSRLLDLMDSKIREIESIDTKRAMISAVDTNALAGLNTMTRKRKYSAFLGGQDGVSQTRRREPPVQRSFQFPEGGAPRAFVPSPSPEHIDSNAVEESDELLSFGTPSDDTSGTQPTSARSIDPHAGNKTDIPANLYEDAFLLAARTLKLPDATLSFDEQQTLPDSIHAGLDHWIASTGVLGSDPPDDRHVCALNLFTSALASAFDGGPRKPGPRGDSVENHSPVGYLSDTPDDVELGFEDDEIGDPPNYEVSEQHSQAEDQPEEETEQFESYGSPESEGARSDRPWGLDATKQTYQGSQSESSGGARISPSPVGNCIPPIRITGSKRTWAGWASTPSGAMATMSGLPNQASPGWLESGKNGAFEDQIEELQYSRAPDDQDIREGTASAYSSQESMTLPGKWNATRILGPRLFSDDIVDIDTDAWV